MRIFERFKEYIRPSCANESPRKPNPNTSPTPSSALGLRQTHSLLRLPRELLHQITSYLPNRDAASLSLTSYDILCILGTYHLHKHTRYDKDIKDHRSQRHKFEILERAFPSHWYCGWCDTFHEQDYDGGPKRFTNEPRRDCVRDNSLLHVACTDQDIKDYCWRDFVITYHHVRLAIHRAKWGPEYGIPLSDFNYTHNFMIPFKPEKFSFYPDPDRDKGRVKATLKTEARVVDGERLYLHCECTVFLPEVIPYLKSMAKFRFRFPLHEYIVQHLPHILVGHRHDRGGHTGLISCMKQVDKALAQGTPWYSYESLCSFCATDYKVDLEPAEDAFIGGSAGEMKTVLERAAAGPWVLKIETWRDLGDGSDSFDPRWRGHGDGKDIERGNVKKGKRYSEPNPSFDILALTKLRTGDIRHAFERGSS